MSDRVLNRLFSTQSLLRVGAGLALMVLGSVAVAQNAANGKVLYEDRGLLCSGCHLADPSVNFQSIRNGANNPAAILAACADTGNRFGQMFVFCGPGKLSAAQAGDIAAYIANPKALGAAIAVDTTALTFKRSIGGGASGRQSVKVTNTGDASLLLTTVALAGTNAADYKLLAPAAGGTQCVSGTSVAAKASCSVDITFDPSVVGTRTAEVKFTPDAGTGLAAVSVALNGTGTQAAEVFATADVATLDFGTQVVKTASGKKTVTVTSSGEADLKFDAANAFVLSGTNATDFVVETTGSCAPGGVVTANGSSCTIQLTFNPSVVGNSTATLTVNSNGTDLVVPLSGAGVLENANDGSAGCSIADPARKSAFDPMLLLLSALAFAVLGLRRRQQR